MKWPKFLTKSNPAMRSILAMFGFSKGPVWRTVNYANLTEEGYKNCAAVFACVSAIVKPASRIEWTIAKKAGKGNWNEFDEHPILDLLAKPNENEGGIRFAEKVFSFLLLSGNSYIYRNSGVNSAAPANLYVLRPDRMTINKSTDWRNPIDSYSYNPGMNPVTFDPALILHLTEFHPLDDWYGLSRIEVAAHQVDISNEAMTWNMKLLKNDMRTPGVLLGKSTFDIEKLKKMFKENYQGSENAGMPLIFEGEDLKWQNLSLNPKDVDWLNGQKYVMRQICSIFGVASQLLGDTEATTYANYQEARKALYMETILPLMDIYRDDLNSWLVPLYGTGLRLDYDRDGIEAIQEERGKKYAYLALADWLTLNEKREATGFDEVEGGDVILVPISNIPLEEATAPPEPPPDLTPADPNAQDEGETAPADEPPVKSRNKSARKVIKAVKKSFWTNADRQKALWANFETRVRAREKSFLELAKTYMRGQALRIQEKVRVKPGLNGLRAEDLLDAKAETDLYVTRFTPWYRDHFIRAGNAGMRAAKGELFDDGEFKADKPSSWVFNMTPEQEAKLRDMIFNSGTKVNETTIEKIYAELIKAQDENMTVSEFARTIGEKVDELSRSRAMLWARTESAKTDNFGQVEGFKQTEFVDMKGWLCSFLPTSREDHMAASDQEVGVDESFKVGNEMLAYPGDPNGSAGQVCNCACSVYPVVGPGAGE